MTVGYAQRRRAYAHASTHPAPRLRVLPTIDKTLEEDPPEQGPLFDRHPLELLRKMVRRNTAAQFEGWSHGIQAKEITYIIGVTSDEYVVYSDGIGMGMRQIKEFVPYLLGRMREATAAGKRYDRLVRDYLLHGGCFPPSENNGSC